VSRPRVILVNDEQDILQVVADRLEWLGLDVTMATSGDECLARLAECVPDLVLLDVQMPGTDGIETLTILQQEVPDLPVVMLSASAHPGIAERALELGAQDFLVKPFDPILLKRTVFKALGREL